MQVTCFQSPCADLCAQAPLSDSMSAETLNGRWFGVGTTRTSGANPGNAGWSEDHWETRLTLLWTFSVGSECSSRPIILGV